MFNFLKKGSESIVQKQIKSGFISAKQVIMVLPKKELNEIGGIQELIKQTKINIASSLQLYGFTKESRIIDGLDIKSYTNLDQLNKGICRSVGVC